MDSDEEFPFVNSYKLMQSYNGPIIFPSIVAVSLAVGEFLLAVGVSLIVICFMLDKRGRYLRKPETYMFNTIVYTNIAIQSLALILNIFFFEWAVIVGLGVALYFAIFVSSKDIDDIIKKEFLE